MFELCLPFLDLTKDMWKKIDPTYIPSGLRIDLTDETPICTKKEFKQQLKFPKEYGTISVKYRKFIVSLGVLLYGARNDSFWLDAFYS